MSPKHAQNAAWGGFRLDIFLDIQGCWSFLRLALPGILMVGTEWAAFEIVALAAGRLGELPVAAQSIIMTTDQTFEVINTIPFGIGVAATTRVGNYIGSRSVPGSRRSAHASIILSVIVGAVVMAVLMCFKDVYGRLFSDEEDVVNLVASVMPLVASFQIADGLANSCGGVLRGQGNTTFVESSLLGLWIGPAGQVVGLFLVGLGELFVVLRTDWRLRVLKSPYATYTDEYSAGA
ncbi:hypothetical protein H0H92_014791 [Tricholoma furcatifolium]|nr:hypothetical protein H0H92_014791 [Tricholoma furcatifolium]